jgi:hypothetical protein
MVACAALASAGLPFATAVKLASAQTPSNSPPAKLLLSPPPDIGKALSRDQLRSCMTRAMELAENDKRVLEAGTKIEQERVALEAKGVALKKAQRTLNRSSRAAVDDFNKRVNALNEEQKAFNTAADAVNTLNRKGQALMYAYNVDCAGRPFKQADEAAVRAELGFSENPMKTVRRP